MQKYDGQLFRKFQDSVDGIAAVGIAVTVRVIETGDNAVLYSDSSGLTIKNNPTTTDENGYYFFYAEDGNYKISFSNGFPEIEIVLGSSSKSISHLKQMPSNPKDKDSVRLTSFYDGWASQAKAPSGGGSLVYNASLAKTNNNGGTIIAPEAITAWAGTQLTLSTLSNWTGAGNGCWVRQLNDDASPELFGAVGDGTADDKFSISKALGFGDVKLQPKSRYRITSRIDMPSGRTIKGDRTSVIEMDGSQFTGTSQYSSTALGFLFNSLSTSGGLQGFQIKLTNQNNELIAGAVAVRSCSNIKLTDLEISGFRKSKVIAIDSSTNCQIDGNTIRDCLLASTTTGQLTGIDVDNNRVSSVASSRLSICENTILNLTCSTGFNASFGYQTDGINISHASSSKHTINRNTMSNVGEGVDCFGSSCSISDNVVHDAYAFGIKLIHGASRNTVTENKIYNAGLAGIVVTGSGTALTNTEFNDVSNNYISGVNKAGNWSSSVTSGIRVDNDNGARYANKNTIKNNIITDGSAMKYGLLLDTGSRFNDVLENKVESFTLGELANSGSSNSFLTGNWYATGTWFPSLRGSTGYGDITFSNQYGIYTKVGKMLTIWGRISIQAITSPMTGELEIYNLPFASVSGDNIYSVNFAQHSKVKLNSAAGYYQLAGRIINNADFITLMQSGNNLTATQLNAQNDVDVGTAFIFSATYMLP